MTTRLHFFDSGPRRSDEAPAILLMHGFPFNQRMWDPQIQALSASFRVIAPDLPGHGKTGAGDRHLLIDFHVDEALALLDQLGIEKAVFCGLSMGGYVALRAVQRAPERVAGLVLCATRSEADTDEARLKRAASIRLIRDQGLPAFAEGFLKGVLAPETLSEKPELVERVRSMILENPVEGICATLIALAARTDTSAVLEGIRVPALLLYGDRDVLTPPALGEAMSRGIPRAEFHVIPRAAHLCTLENAAETTRCMVSFLERHFRGSSGA